MQRFPSPCAANRAWGAHGDGWSGMFFGGRVEARLSGRGGAEVGSVRGSFSAGLQPAGHGLGGYLGLRPRLG